MTRFALLTFAMFTSACAADVDATSDATSDDFRASVEEVELDTERSTSSQARIASKILAEYGPIAAEYGCDVVSAVFGTKTSNSGPINGAMISESGRTQAKFKATVKSVGNQDPVIVGRTGKGSIEGSEYVFKGMVDGPVVEAEMIALDDGSDLEMFGELHTGGRALTLRGIVADCN